MKRAYADAGLTDVQFLGEVQADRLPELLARASVFCLPSHWEGFPLSVLEAMASEAAVVATAVGDVPVILDDGRAGMVIEPHDREALERALRTLADDPATRHRLGELGRERVEREFPKERVMRSLGEVYDELARLRRRIATS